MAKKNGKPGKDKKKLVKKPVAKANGKKAAKPVKKAAPAKKVAKKPAATPKAVAKPAGKGAKSVLKAVAKVVVTAAKKAIEKPEKAAKGKGAKAAPAPAKGGPAAGKAAAKANGKEGKGKAAAAPAAVEETELEAGEEEELADEEIVLTDAEGRRYCRVKDCDQLSAVDGYCRYHYLALWKKIQVRKKILSEGKLERYIEELTARYPDKFLEMLRKDLRSEKEFLAAIQELEIDENAVDNEFEDEAQNYIDEVRGMEPAARDEEDF